jgi:aspartate carbamoyltransferase catalytic subunit
MTFKSLNFLSVEQLTVEKIEQLCALALKLEDLARARKITFILRGAILANLFFEPSTRTRMSFEAAFKILGGAVINLHEKNSSSLSKGESLYDMSRVVSSYADVIVMRHPDEESVRDFAEAATVPLINAGNGTGEHPTQALVDLYTILKECCGGEFERLRSMKVCFVGDLKHGRTVHSLIKALSFFKDIEFSLVSPASLKVPDALIKNFNGQQRFNETTELKEGVANADLIYVTRIQEERFDSHSEFAQHAGAYSIDKAFYEANCKPNAILMHPMPRDSRLEYPEIDSDLNDHPSLAMFRQSGNGLPVRMALFCLIFGIEEKIFNHIENPLYR